MRHVYAELARPDGTPLAGFDDAFKPYNGIVFQEWQGDTVKDWPLPFARNRALPGDGGLFPRPDSLLRVMIDCARINLRQILRLRRGSGYRLVRAALRAVPTLRKAAKEMRRSGPEGDRRPNALKAAARGLVAAFEDAAEHDDIVRRHVILLDLALTGMAGMISDRLGERGFDAVDDEDFVAWLRRHGASEMSVNSAIVTGLYSLVFAIPADGTPNSGLAAGAAFRTALRILYTYKGAISYKMQASSGETLFTPLYQVLRRRGV